LIGRRRGSCERRRERLSDEEPFFAVGAGFKIPAGELIEEYYRSDYLRPRGGIFFRIDLTDAKNLYSINSSGGVLKSIYVFEQTAFH
jgi:hypothetical protein